MDDTVGVDVEGHLDLRYTARRRRDAGQLEVAEGLVVAGHVPLTLEDVNGYCRLVVGGRGEDLGFSTGDGGVLVDKSGHHTAQSFDPKRERGDIKEENILHISFQNAGLYGCADSNNFVR